MRKLCSLILPLVLSLVQAGAQTTPFTQVAAALQPLGFSACAWGDYDNDGDLDLVLSGYSGIRPMTCLYRNEAGNFTLAPVGLPGFSNTSAEWGDADSDHDLDLLITGLDTLGEPATALFLNNNGQFARLPAALPGVSDGQAAWGDMDNDGDLDILIAGSFKAAICKNDGNGQFTPLPVPFTPVQMASCSWVDYNNDGQLDALVNGDSGGGMVTNLYRNNNGQFTKVVPETGELLGVAAGRCRWADLDLDGKQDLVLAGMDLNADGHLVVYRNEGDDRFTLFDAMSSNVRYSSVDLADYDADGYTDILFIGKINGCGGTATTMLFQNLGFMQFFEVTTTLPGFRNGGVNWGDFNNDGYSDLLLTGVDGYEAAQTGIWMNNGGSGLFTPNTPPAQPAALTAETFPGKVVLRWSAASDLQTPVNALTYNLMIGTSPGTSDRFPCMADPASGLRGTVAPGSCTADTTWEITGLPAGDYWFSVQALDNGHLGGGFAPPVAFAFDPVGVAEEPGLSVTVEPNPCTDRFIVRMPAGYGESRRAGLEVFSSHGIRIYSGRPDEWIDASSWARGAYFMVIRLQNDTFRARLVKI